jgi:hypothetical protein
VVFGFVCRILFFPELEDAAKIFPEAKKQDKTKHVSTFKNFSDKLFGYRTEKKRAKK